MALGRRLKRSSPNMIDINYGFAIISDFVLWRQKGHLIEIG